jgi:hypothetical protein
MYSADMKTSACLAILAVCFNPIVRADVIECTNGDRYNGRVLLVDDQNVKFESEINGAVTLPRAKVISIQFNGAKATVSKTSTLSTNELLAPAPAKSTLPKLPSLNSKPGFDPKAVDQVENELLGDATPEAQAMYRQMVQGLMNGKLNLGDIQSQAQSALNQLKELQKDLGEDDDTPVLGGYIGILENFLKETKKEQPAAPAPPRTKAEEGP